MSARLAAGAGWVIAARLVILIFGFGNTIVLARLLAPEDFGLVAISTTISTIVIAVTELSMSHALVQHEDPQDDHFHTAFTCNILRSFGVGLFLSALSWPVAWIYNDTRLIPMLIVLGFGNVLQGALNPRLAVMMRNLVFWQDFAIRFGEKLFNFTAACLVAWIWDSYWALIVGILAGQTVALITSYVVIRYRPRLTVSKWRDLFSFSVWLTLGQLVNTVNWQFDQLVVGYLLGTRDLGFYAVGSRLANLPTREATQPISQVVFPAFTRIRNDLDRLRAAYTRAQTLLTAVALAAGIGFAVAAHPLVMLSMGEKWLPIVPTIQLLSGVFALQTIGVPVQQLCMALGKTRILFTRSLINLSIRVPLIILGLVLGGLHGLLLARIVTGLIGLSINIWLVSGLIGLSPWQQLFANHRSILSAGVMSVVVWLIGQAFGDVSGGMILVQAFAMCLAMPVVFLTSLILIWIVEGRPAGPETDILKGIRKVVARFVLTPQPST